jgi:hypothetical protein
MESINFELRFVPAGTGSSVWDDPSANHIVQRFMLPKNRQHGPMIGILHLGALRPTPQVLHSVIVTIGEDVRAGRYGNFTFIVSSEDDATRNVVSDIASAQGLPIFISTSSTKLDKAEPVGDLTAKDRETLCFVLGAGGTVTSGQFAEQLGIEQTTAGNRLTALHKKGYLQRIERPHPIGDQFIDSRSVRFD